MKGFWQKIFRDVLFEGGKVPSPEERKKFYDRCFRRVKRMFKKQGLKPSRSDFAEELDDCLLTCFIVFSFKMRSLEKMSGRISRQEQEIGFEKRENLKEMRES